MQVPNSGWNGRAGVDPVVTGDARQPIIERGVACSNSDQPVRTATRRCLPTRWKRAFAPTNARSAPRASTTSWKTSARTAAVDLFPDQLGRRGTGKATTSLGSTQGAPRSSTGPLIRKSMRGSRQPSSPYRLTTDKVRDDDSQQAHAPADACVALERQAVK